MMVLCSLSNYVLDTGVDHTGALDDGAGFQWIPLEKQLGQMLHINYVCQRRIAKAHQSSDNINVTSKLKEMVDCHTQYSMSNQRHNSESGNNKRKRLFYVGTLMSMYATIDQPKEWQKTTLECSNSAQRLQKNTYLLPSLLSPDALTQYMQRGEQFDKYHDPTKNMVEWEIIDAS